MALSVAGVLVSALDGTLTLAECETLLQDSEGATSNANPHVGGHALQHSAQVAPNSPGFRRIDDKYHDRGPLQSTGQRNFRAEAPALDGVNQWGRATKVPGPGEVTEIMTGASHSQFSDDRQAALMLKLGLSCKAGLVALRRLAVDPTDSLCVTLGAPGGTQYNERSTHLNAVPAEWKRDGDKFTLKTGRPTAAQLLSNDNFVLVNRVDMGSVVIILRADGLGPNARLHVQTCYPQGEAMSWGSSRVESQNSPALDHTFLH